MGETVVQPTSVHFAAWRGWKLSRHGVMAYPMGLERTPTRKQQPYTPLSPFIHFNTPFVACFPLPSLLDVGWLWPVAS